MSPSRWSTPPTPSPSFQALSAGDECAAIAIDKMCDYLALAMSQISCIVDPGMYLIGGGVAGGFSTFAPKLRERFQELAHLAVPRRQDRGRRPRQPGGHVRLRVRGAAPARRAEVAAPRSSRLPAKPRFWVFRPSRARGRADSVTSSLVLGNKLYVLPPFRRFCINRFAHKREERGTFRKSRRLSSNLLPTTSVGAATAPDARPQPDVLLVPPPCRLSVMGARGSFDGPASAHNRQSAQAARRVACFVLHWSPKRENHRRPRNSRQMVSFTETATFFSFFAFLRSIGS